jgi:hypothetical protein
MKLLTGFFQTGKNPLFCPMHHLIDDLAKSVFKKNSIRDCSLDELKSFKNKYPSWPAAQLLYVSKLKAENNPDFSEEIQKASLYFTNPLWLDFLLDKTEKSTEIPAAEMHRTVVPLEDPHNDELVVRNPLNEFTIDKSLLKTPAADIPKTEEPKPAESELAFEPYHTVDYFASQGIKPKLDEQPKDQFGKQLKSFTEWLKTLKTTAARQPADTPADEVSEKKVITLADHSIEDRNVVTEAMAEVWIKQGEPGKAIEIYQKLSLHNPSKSSYFAGLIEKLKKN